MTSDLIHAKNMKVKAATKIILDVDELTLGCGLHAVVGPNGAGKSTLLNVLSGDLLCDANICFSGERSSSLLAEQRAQQLSVLNQHSDLRFAFSVAEVVGLGRYPHSTGKIIDSLIVKECLEALDLTKLKTRDYTSLSGGEKQRCQIARALCQLWRAEDSKHRIFLLDEPSSALDIKHQHALMKLLIKLASEGACIFIIMHDINLALRYCEQLIIMQNGSVIKQGPVKTLCDEQLFSSVFETDVHIHIDSISSKPILNFYA